MHTYRPFSRFVVIGARLAILASMLMASFGGGVMSVAAAPLHNLNSVTVGSQSGALTFGAAGDVSFDVSIDRTNSSPGTISLSVTGLPAGASQASPLPADSIPFTTDPQIVTLTIHFDGDVATNAGMYDFTVQAQPVGQGGPSRSGTGTLVVDKASQMITFDPLADKTFGDPDFSVSATASSGLAVTFTAGGACMVSGTTVSLTGVGNCWITASQSGDANFLAAPNVVRQFAILPAAGAPATDFFDLYAMSGSTVMPGAVVPVPVWGYTQDGSPITQPGGPILTAGQGDTVVITLHNNLLYDTSLLIQGQDMIPDTAGVAAGGTKSYVFSASKPGSFLYEAGLLAGGQYQVAMGLYGALIVNPAIANQAYDDASTAFDAQNILVLSELDPALNNSSNPAVFDIRNYSPQYFLINGKAYPDTAPIDLTAGQNVLMRYVNAGLQAHAMSTLGLSQNIIAQDGEPYLYSHKVVAETIATGETLDTIVAVPATAAAGSSFALYDANMLLHNTTAAGFGGMLTFMSIAGTVGPGGPVTSNVTLTPNVTNGSSPIALDAIIGVTGDPAIDAAEYFVDTVGQDGFGCAITSIVGGAPATVSATIPTSGATAPCVDLATLSSGSHTFYVHGQNANGWGSVASDLLNLDKTGPSISALQLSPNPSDGSANVNLSFTASDIASGNSDVTTVDYWVDAGAHQSFTFTPAPSVNLSAVIPMGLSEGTHTVSVQATDALNNVGTLATIDLVIDQTGPTTGNVMAAPNPNNGSMGLNTSVPAVRVTADSFTDTASNVAGAEGFIDLPPGATGTGFVFVATDGNFDSLSEPGGYADIPLAVVAALSDGDHTISVHAKDAAGNWGGFSTTTLTIDKTPPTIISAMLTPNTIAFGAASVTLDVVATDGGVILNGGRYWIDGTGVPPATAVSFTGTSAMIDTSALAGGSHTVYVQMQDAVANWSTPYTVSLYVVLAVNDAVSFNANGSAGQTSDQSAPGLLANDLPTGMGTASLASAAVRTSGNGSANITLSCPGSLGTSATPSVGGQTICTNGAYRVAFTNVTGNNNNQRANSKRGTYQFTYTLTLNGVTSIATVTITVN